MPSVLLDENITPQLVEALQAEGIAATTARASGLLGAGDARVLLTAARQGLTLVTADLDDFWNLHEA